jgi:hypothetical protein
VEVGWVEMDWVEEGWVAHMSRSTARKEGGQHGG